MLFRSYCSSSNLCSCPKCYQGHISSHSYSQSTNSIPVYQLYLPATSRVDFLYPLKILVLSFVFHVVSLPCHIFFTSVQYVWEGDQLIFTATRLLCVYRLSIAKPGLASSLDTSLYGDITRGEIFVVCGALITAFLLTQKRYSLFPQISHRDYSEATGFESIR